MWGDSTKLASARVLPTPAHLRKMAYACLDFFQAPLVVLPLRDVRGKQWERGDDHLRACRLSSNLLFCKCTDVKAFKSFVLNGLTWLHWANSRITEKESNVKNKENGTDGALC